MFSEGMLRISPGSRLTVAKMKKTQISKANQALVVAPTGLNLTVAPTNVKMVSIMLSQVRIKRPLSATCLVIKPVPPTLGTTATKKTTHMLTLTSQ